MSFVRVLKGNLYIYLGKSGEEDEREEVWRDRWRRRKDHRACSKHPLVGLTCSRKVLHVDIGFRSE